MEEQAASEGLTTTEYELSFLRHGWGGIPELDALDYVIGLNASVEDERGCILWASRIRDQHAVRWRLAESHFTLIGRGYVQETSSELPSMRIRSMACLRGAMHRMRGGMPRVTLRSRSQCRT